MDQLRKVISAITCAAMVVAQAGCATIVGGSKQNIAVDSTPDGATVTSNRAGMAATMEYTTPTAVLFERKGHYILTFKKEGYDSKQIELMRGMRGWMLVWDIFWFPIGIIVDAITGAWYRLEPEQVTVTLTKLSADVPGPDRIDISLSGLPSPGKIHIRAPKAVSVSVRSKE